MLLQDMFGHSHAVTFEILFYWNIVILRYFFLKVSTKDFFTFSVNYFLRKVKRTIEGRKLDFSLIKD